MIDWWNLAANFLWILAFAIALAMLSYASWQASLAQIKLRDQLSKPVQQIILSFAGLLFCLGLAGVSKKPVEIVLWLALGLAFAVQCGFLVWKRLLKN